jgi:hypothetical protein
MIAIALAILACGARWRTVRSAKSAVTMQFEEEEDTEIISLQLPSDILPMRKWAISER